MTSRTPSAHRLTTRLRALLQAFLFVATIVSAPYTHEWTCRGACARQTPAEAGPGAVGAVGEPGAVGEADTPPCHRGHASDGKRHGCQCTDDCCSIWAHFVAPPDLEYRGAPAHLVETTVPGVPEPAPRGAGPRLLPYPTGPPSAS